MCWKTFFYHDKNKFLFWGAEQKLTTIRFVELAHKNICQKNVRWKILERKELPIIYFWVLEMAKEPSPISDSLETREPGRFFLKLSRIVGVSRSALPKTIMQLTKNAGLEDDFPFQSGISYDFHSFLFGGSPYQPLKNFTRGGEPLNTWKFSGLYITQPWRPPHCHQWGNLRWKHGEIICMAEPTFCCKTHQIMFEASENAY